jgi:exodeoxyribonuclease III
MIQASLAIGSVAEQKSLVPAPHARVPGLTSFSGRRGPMAVQKRLSLDAPGAARSAESGDRRELHVFTWNLRNPSLRRAEMQAAWLEGCDADVLILTELKMTAAAELHCDSLERRGYRVEFPTRTEEDYCVLVAARGKDVRMVELGLGYLPHRALALSFRCRLGRITVVGLYVPSRGPLERRNVAKRRFQKESAERIDSLVRSSQGDLIVGGDLNVVERSHVPSYPVFGDWEYRFYESFLNMGLHDAFRTFRPHENDHSWFGRGGNGYRFDHLFVSSCLAARIGRCGYVHSVREEKLSDHSAMEVIVRLEDGYASLR